MERRRSRIRSFTRHHSPSHLPSDSHLPGDGRTARNQGLAANDDSAKVAQITVDPQVNVSFSNTKNSSWTSIAGRAEIVHDRAKCRRVVHGDADGLVPRRAADPGADTDQGPRRHRRVLERTQQHRRSRPWYRPRGSHQEPDNDPVTNDTVQL